jgi:opacity protein-like surface antigen
MKLGAAFSSTSSTAFLASSIVLREIHLFIHFHNYHPKNDHVSDFQLGLDVQYLIHISDKFKIYPQIGYGFAFVKEDTYTTTNGQSSITVEGGNKTDGGFQIGAGLQYNLGENWFIGADYRFQPAILGRVHVIMASVGYRF